MAEALPGLRLGRAICGELAQAERREWWLGNGLGGYAAGTLAGSLTRRYHGLLIAPLEEALDRRLLLAKADASWRLDGREYPLFSNRWADGSVTPSGHRHLESFRLEGRMPVWCFTIGDASLEMRIWLEPGVHQCHLAYRLQGRSSASLRIDLLANLRDHHGSMPVGGFVPEIHSDDNGLRLALGGDHQLWIACQGGRITPRQSWYRGFRLSREGERGLDDLDNHLCVGQAEIELSEGRWAGLSARLDGPAQGDLEAAMGRFLERDRQLLAETLQRLPEFAASPPWIRQLLLSADSFLFRRPLPQGEPGESIIAGYPWFGDWGRDSMIALPGLTLASGRHASALGILRTFTGLLDQGMLPNRLVVGEGAEYNTADATLWFIEAWRAYGEASHDPKALRQVYPLLRETIDWHIRGTRHGIRMDPQDRLLRAGEPGVQLTWMDAKVGDWVVTPRIGKPVEINALWYNALCSLVELASRLGEPDLELRELAERVAASMQRYLRPDGGLYDLLDGPQGDDPSVRPNQIFAVSLPHCALNGEARQGVVAECGRQLLTSYGLRSLAPGDPAYRPEYRGGVYERDGAYHQGTVWAWLLGHYALAEYRVSGDAAAAQRRLEPLADQLLDAGLGTLGEIFDGAPPHRPRGAPAQAWSVACTLEAWWRLQKIRNGQS